MKVGDIMEVIEKSHSTNILSLDVGTTTIRATVYDKSANIIGTGSSPVSYFMKRRKRRLLIYF